MYPYQPQPTPVVNNGQNHCSHSLMDRLLGNNQHHVHVAQPQPSPVVCYPAPVVQPYPVAQQQPYPMPVMQPQQPYPMPVMQPQQPHPIPSAPDYPPVAYYGGRR
jgi:hypothetical protein